MIGKHNAGNHNLYDIHVEQLCRRCSAAFGLFLALTGIHLTYWYCLIVNSIRIHDNTDYYSTVTISMSLITSQNQLPTE